MQFKTGQLVRGNSGRLYVVLPKLPITKANNTRVIPAKRFKLLDIYELAQPFPGEASTIRLTLVGNNFKPRK